MMRLSIFRSALAACVAGAVAVSPVMADGTLDGTIGAGYGAPIAIDGFGDRAGFPGNMDLGDLYFWENGTDIYFAMTANGTDSWGNYMFFIEADNAALKAGSSDGNGWVRPISAPGAPGFAPSHWIGSWNGGAQLWQFVGAGNGSGGTGNGWNQTHSSTVNPADIDQNFDFSAAPATLELRVSRAALGNPATVRIVGMSSGTNGGDTAVDSVPSNADPANWGDPVILSNATSPIAVPVELSAFGLD